MLQNLKGGEAAFHQGGFSSKQLFIEYVMGVAFHQT
jgi:hypothetical protein